MGTMNVNTIFYGNPVVQMFQSGPSHGLTLPLTESSVLKV